MGLASVKQNFQDWTTQQWVILFGQKIYPSGYEWLIGPFGETKGIGQKFIEQLAASEHLEIGKQKERRGLIQSINQLALPDQEVERLSKNVIDFYVNTSDYQFELKVNWNPFFKVLGALLKVLFSNRIEQLNLPMGNDKDDRALKSEIIQLVDRDTKALKRTIWLRTFKKSNQVVYSGVYETCIIPEGSSCIKAVFPLPNGNATVILKPSVGKKGELILKSSGSKIGDSGFYFLLKDTKGNLWAKYIKSFKDQLVVASENGEITAIQTLTFWNMKVLEFEYYINKRSPCNVAINNIKEPV